MIQRKCATAEKAAWSVEAGGATWKAVITQEGGERGGGPTCISSAGRGDRPSPLPTALVVASTLFGALTWLTFLFHHRGSHSSLKDILKIRKSEGLNQNNYCCPHRRKAELIPVRVSCSALEQNSSVLRTVFLTLQ